MRAGGPQMIEAGRARLADGVVGWLLAPTPAIQHNQHHRTALLHQRFPLSLPCLAFSTASYPRVVICPGRQFQRSIKCVASHFGRGAEVIRKILSAWIMLQAGGWFVAAQAGVERPPQFVVMTFDNCTELERWQELTDFAAEMNKDGDRLHFTFFVSGINFIADAHRSLYEGPHQRRGSSRINFGGSAEDVRKRVDYVNALYASGHEIASHAVGHFNGGGWSAADWGKEFQAFDDILDKVGPNNGVHSKLAFESKQVVGFRAPYLAKSAGLYTVLKGLGFRYDTSGVMHSNLWPEKVDGIWRFNLAILKMHGEDRRMASMDYNFFVAHSRAVPDVKRQEVFREQMLQTYLDYFKANYTGNRAPLHIGHHFFDYQGGAYREALKAFARAVCGLPEVRCTSYAKLADFMDKQSGETLAAYQAGDFPRAVEPAVKFAGN